MTETHTSWRRWIPHALTGALVGLAIGLPAVWIQSCVLKDRHRQQLISLCAGDVPELSSCEAACALDHWSSCAIRAAMYKDGKGGSAQSYGKAAEYYQRSCAEGHDEDSCIYVAAFHRAKQLRFSSSRTAADLMRPICASGNYGECYQLALMYGKGENDLEKDDDEFEKFLARACAGKFADSCELLASRRAAAAAAAATAAAEEEKKNPSTGHSSWWGLVVPAVMLLWAIATESKTVRAVLVTLLVVGGLLTGAFLYLVWRAANLPSNPSEVASAAVPNAAEVPSTPSAYDQFLLEQAVACADKKWNDFDGRFAKLPTKTFKLVNDERDWAQQCGTTVPASLQIAFLRQNDIFARRRYAWVVGADRIAGIDNQEITFVESKDAAQKCHDAARNYRFELSSHGIFVLQCPRGYVVPPAGTKAIKTGAQKIELRMVSPN